MRFVPSQAFLQCQQKIFRPKSKILHKLILQCFGTSVYFEQTHSHIHTATNIITIITSHGYLLAINILVSKTIHHICIIWARVERNRHGDSPGLRGIDETNWQCDNNTMLSQYTKCPSEFGIVLHIWKMHGTQTTACTAPNSVDQHHLHRPITFTFSQICWRLFIAFDSFEDQIIANF